MTPNIADIIRHHVSLEPSGSTTMFSWGHGTST
jgi:hypothetical protein